MEVRSREDFDKLKQLPFFKGIIKSDSMEPLIKVGDRILVEVGAEELKRFDVIVFWKEDSKELICHYMWAINRIVTPILYQTRSLRYDGNDHPIMRDHYLGKVISHKITFWTKVKILFRYLMK